MKIHKEGIVKFINESEWQRYRELGFTKIYDNEPKPILDEEEADDEQKPKSRRGRV